MSKGGPGGLANDSESGARRRRQAGKLLDVKPQVGVAMSLIHEIESQAPESASEARIALYVPFSGHLTKI